MAEKVLSASNKALTLTQRKHVRDNQEHHDKHIKRIAAATGVEGWTYDFEGDIAAFSNALAEDRRENFGGVLLAAYLDSTAEMFERNCKDAMVKAAVVAALPKKQIFFKPLAAKPDGKHQEVKIENGALYIGCAPGSWWCNISDIYNQEMAPIIPAGGASLAAGEQVLSENNGTLSLVQRKHIRDNKVHLEKHIKRIEASTGVSGWTYDFEGDLAAFAKSLKDREAEMVGGILSAAYLDSIAEMLEKNLKDDMVKEAFNETVTSKKIIFAPLAEKPQGIHQKVWVKDATLYYGCAPASFWCNLSDITNFKLETAL